MRELINVGCSKKSVCDLVSMQTRVPRPMLPLPNLMRARAFAWVQGSRYHKQA
jgi:hypothetical protein